MHGNVNEWTHDWYLPYPEKSIVDPVVSEGGLARVLRGGCSNFDAAAYGRTVCRRPAEPTASANDCGFRMALSPSVTSQEAAQEKK
jgi:formylglycine-generating enzyme required for sulfatase activity